MRIRNLVSAGITQEFRPAVSKTPKTAFPVFGIINDQPVLSKPSSRPHLPPPLPAVDAACVENFTVRHMFLRHRTIWSGVWDNFTSEISPRK